MAINTQGSTLPTITAESLLPNYIAHDQPSHIGVLIPQLRHRIHLIQNVWRIPPGSRVLEIGCGQGDCTLVLAAVVGEHGGVVAIDPCDLNYGSPYTVGAAQSYIKSSALGERIRFVQADPVDFLTNLGSYAANSSLSTAGTTSYSDTSTGDESPGNATITKCAIDDSAPPHHRFDYVVLVHSLFYFSCPAQVSALLSVLFDQQKRNILGKICIAEWSLTAQLPSQMAHVLAVSTRGQLEALRKARGEESTANIQCLITPAWIRRYAEANGKNVEREDYVEAAEGMLDAKWEISDILGDQFEKDVRRLAGIGIEEETSMERVLLAGGDAVRAVEAGRKVSDEKPVTACMPVWACVI